MAINLSDYISMLVKPEGSGLRFTIPVPAAAALNNLPGVKRLHITLTTGDFAQGSGEGGTGREDGYAPFDPAFSQNEFTLLIQNLQPQPLADGTTVLKGVAALALEQQRLAVLDTNGATVGTADAGLMIVTRIHFAWLSLKAGKRYLLTRVKPLLALTAKTDVAKLCVVYREDALPGLTLVPGSHFVTLSTTGGPSVPNLALEFYTADPRNTQVFNRGVANGQPAWTPFPGAVTPISTADGEALSLSSGGKTTFALAKK